MTKKHYYLTLIRIFISLLISCALFSSKLLLIYTILVILPLPFELWYYTKKKHMHIDIKMMRKIVILFCVYFTIRLFVYYGIELLSSSLIVSEVIDNALIVAFSAIIVYIYNTLYNKKGLYDDKER